MANTVKVQGSKTVARARKGDTGNGGITYRITVWEDGKEYRNDSSLKTDGERIIDIAVNKAMSLIGDTTFKAFKCRVTHTSDTQSRPLAAGTYWEAINTLQPIVTPVLLANVISADYIDVENLVAQKLTVKDSDDNVIAKIGDMSNYTVDGVSGKFPFWIGGSMPATAVTRIDSAGKLTTTNIVATGGTIGGFSISSTGIGTLGATSLHSESSYLENARLYLDSIDFTYGARQAILDARKRGNNLLYLQCLNYTSIGPLAYLETSGAEAIRVASGMFGGFRPYISTRVSGTLADYENVVVCNNNSAYTISLPSSPKKGQMYLIYHLTSTQITISGNGNNIRRLTASGLTTVSSTTSGSIECVMCNWDGSYWYLTYIKVS